MIGISLNVNALLNDAYAYLSFDNADNVGGNKLRDSANTTHNATNNTLDFGRTLVLGEAYESTGSPDWIGLNKGLGTPVTNINFTYVIWFKTNDGTTDASLIRPNSGAGDTSMLFSSGNENNKVRCLADTSIDAGTVIATSDTVGVMTMAVCRYNGTALNLYINKTLEASDPASGFIDANTEILIGKHASNVEYFTGYIDELGIWMRDIDKGCSTVGQVCTGEIADLFNNGAGFNPYIVVPNITMNFPKDNNVTHNKTIVFNFTIDDPNSDKINYTLWADTNLTPDTNINQTLNVTEGTFIFNYTFGTEINGSINGTYYWKVNGTDNNSNNFQSSIFTFNITNNISLYNVTNVSITSLPLSVGTEAKCHFNITNKAGQEDIISISDQRWWLNNTLVAEAGNKTLSAGNVTLNSNITCEARINNGYGETSWTEYVNSSRAVVGDSTNPTLNNCTLSSTSITDASGNTINLTCDATDASSNIQTMVASLNGTINKTLTFSFTQSQNVIATRTIFQSEETLLVGSYSINQVNVTDTSSNKLSNTTKDLHFIVTSAPSSGGTTGGGGGGGGLQTVIVEKNETIITGQCNFNNKCEPQFGEDSFNCNLNAGGDCEFKYEEILPTCLIDKNQQCVWRTAIVRRILLIATIISFLILISDTQQGRKVRKVLKERLNINLLKE